MRIVGLWLYNDVARLHVKIDNIIGSLVGFCFIRSIDSIRLAFVFCCLFVSFSFVVIKKLEIEIIIFVSKHCNGCIVTFTFYDKVCFIISLDSPHVVDNHKQRVLVHR
jgi:hypothetical protein